MRPMSAPRRTAPVALGVIALVAAGCGSANSSGPEVGAGGPATDAATPADFGHIHGLAGGDRALIIATHTGLWRAPMGSTKAVRVGTSRRDVMGFTAVGDRLFGSGHPDPDNANGEPPNVGVIRSLDAGTTWQPVALSGEVDFHAFAGSRRSLYGYDGASGRLLASEDGGRTWEERAGAPGEVISIAADPANPDSLLVATPEGVQLSRDGGRSFAPTGVPAGILAWGARDAFAVAADGTVQRSSDRGRTWRPAGSIGALPVAAYASAETLFVAREDGVVLSSTDGGTNFGERARLG